MLTSDLHIHMHAGAYISTWACSHMYPHKLAYVQRVHTYIHTERHAGGSDFATVVVYATGVVLQSCFSS